MANRTDSDFTAPTDPDAAPATFSVLDVSTSHVHPEDLAAVERSPLVAYSDTHGAWVHVPEDGVADTLADLRDDGRSELLCAVIERAAAHGCAYVRFDADGPLDAALAVSERW